jgi:hypothetical protein
MAGGGVATAVAKTTMSSNRLSHQDLIVPLPDWQDVASLMVGADPGNGRSRNQSRNMFTRR